MAAVPGSGARLRHTWSQLCKAESPPRLLSSPLCAIPFPVPIPPLGPTPSPHSAERLEEVLTIKAGEGRSGPGPTNVCSWCGLCFCDSGF